MGRTDPTRQKGAEKHEGKLLPGAPACSALLRPLLANINMKPGSKEPQAVSQHRTKGGFEFYPTPTPSPGLSFFSFLFPHSLLFPFPTLK